MRRVVLFPWLVGLLLSMSSTHLFSAVQQDKKPSNKVSVAQPSALKSIIRVLWQEAIFFSAVDDDLKQLDWVLDVNARVISPYLNYWQFASLLDRLLADATEKPNEIQRQALERALADTMSRYVLEILIDDAIDGRALDALEVLENEGVPHVRLTLSGPFGLPVHVAYVTEVWEGQLRVVDMMVAGVRYSEWKGRSYRERANSGDWETLLTELKAKNREFFAQFCNYPQSGPKQSGQVDGQLNKPRQLPRYLADACHP